MAMKIALEVVLEHRRKRAEADLTAEAELARQRRAQQKDGSPER